MMHKNYRLRFITHETLFEYEVQTLVAMMHWDEFNNAFKLMLLNNSLQKKGTTFQEQYKKAALMKKEQDRLFDIGEVKVRIRKRRGKWCWNFLAATHIQRWWLRINRKFHIYKNIYQLMDKYSVPGGFTEQNSAKYLGIGKNKCLLNIQEDIINKVLEARRPWREHQMAKTAIRPQKCKEVSKTFMKTVYQDVDLARCRETVYGFGPCKRWAKDGGTQAYLCAQCATTDRSYPGSGKASGNLNHPRWAAQCNKCSKKNQYHHRNMERFIQVTNTSPGVLVAPPSPSSPPPSPPPSSSSHTQVSSSCDEGPVGNEGPSSWNIWGRKWFRRLGLTK